VAELISVSGSVAQSCAVPLVFTRNPLAVTADVEVPLTTAGDENDFDD
jgi:hypothetical protein